MGIAYDMISKGKEVKRDKGKSLDIFEIFKMGSKSCFHSFTSCMTSDSSSNFLCLSFFYKIEMIVSNSLGWYEEYMKPIRVKCL